MVEYKQKSVALFQYAQGIIALGWLYLFIHMFIQFVCVHAYIGFLLSTLVIDLLSPPPAQPSGNLKFILFLQDICYPSCKERP
jgi:hypothetical protein